MAVYDDVRLPVDVEVGAKGGPEFQTTITALSSGSEQRNQDWSEKRSKYDIGYGISTLADFNTVRDHFYGRRGRARNFPFKDWTDYQLSLELIGTGNGATTAFQIIKTYEDSGPHSYGRRITRPVSGTLQVYVDGVLKTLTTDYTVALGLITFNSAPANTKLIRVTCEFDVPVRYDTDYFEMTIEAFNAGVVQSLLIREVRE